ncbi:MAG: non-homologous end-joining DNA ligase [Syntrophothermus sp.]
MRAKAEHRRVKPPTKAKPRRLAAKSAPSARSVEAIEGARRGPLPSFVEPCLATLVAAPPEGDDWVHEIKFDGYRIEARIDNGDVRLLTRKGLDWTERFGSLPRLLADLHRGSALIDAELVVEDAEGHSNFTALADALKSGQGEKFVLQCFDLLHLDGVNLVGAALEDRKAVLQKLLAKSSKTGPIRYSPHLRGDAAAMLAEACRLGLEGLISKRADRPYRSGRHDDWLKSKCIQTDEFVVIGYLVSSVSKTAIGALVVGYYDRKRLVYAGRVGTGYTQQTAAELFRQLQPLRLSEPPITQPLTGLQRRGVVWVRPVLVAQVEYRAWTEDGLLRHPAFKGLREDKPAREVTLEVP